ncbi:MAG: hypothetical protein WC795_00560 [Candidatus Paceibacterota bacterium]|jgi:multidrug transporter EmrE-like cation transporter
MSKIHIWFYIIAAVAIAVSANYISVIWANKENRFSSPWLLAVIFISPFVFITFGLVASKLGLAVSSATIDLLLTVSTVLVGLFVLGEWHSISLYQYFGIALAFGGIILMQFHK